jgi:hypothetical protein
VLDEGAPAQLETAGPEGSIEKENSFCDHRVFEGRNLPEQWDQLKKHQFIAYSEPGWSPKMHSLRGIQ